VATKHYAKKIVTARDVIKDTHQDQIHAIVATKTTAKVARGGWIGAYTPALNQVFDGLSKEEKEEAEEEAKRRTECGNPREVQQRLVLPQSSPEFGTMLT
jgi:hypothetical protein